MNNLRIYINKIFETDVYFISYICAYLLYCVGVCNNPKCRNKTLRYSIIKTYVILYN